MKKRTILIFLVSSCLILSCILVGSLAYITLNNYMVLLVASGSMIPTLNLGDFLLVQQGLDIDDVVAEYDTGDIIVFNKPNNPDDLIVHRAVNISESGGTPYIITKGDNNPSSDPWRVYDSNLVGKVIAVNSLPAIIFATSLLGWIVVAVLIAFSVGIYVSLASEKKRQKIMESMPRPPE